MMFLSLPEKPRSAKRPQGQGRMCHVYAHRHAPGWCWSGGASSVAQHKRTMHLHCDSVAPMWAVLHTFGQGTCTSTRAVRRRWRESSTPCSVVCSQFRLCVRPSARKLGPAGFSLRAAMSVVHGPRELGMGSLVLGTGFLTHSSTFTN